MDQAAADIVVFAMTATFAAGLIAWGFWMKAQDRKEQARRD